MNYYFRSFFLYIPRVGKMSQKWKGRNVWKFGIKEWNFDVVKCFSIKALVSVAAILSYDVRETRNNVNSFCSNYIEIN